MIYYLMLASAAVLTTGDFAITKVYQKTLGNAVRESMIFNILHGLFSSVIFFVVGGFCVECTPFSFIMAFLISLFSGTYIMIGFQIMSIGSVTVYTIFLMLGGAVVPYVYGLMFLEETINGAKVLALILIVLAVVLNAAEKRAGKQSAKFILLCIAVFFLNGAVSVVSKMHQIETNYAVVSVDAFILLKSIVKFVLFALLFLLCGRKTEAAARKKMPIKMAILIFSSVGISNMGYMLQLISASHLPATVLYPIMTGGTIVATALFDRICFGNRANRRTKISIIICMIALVLFVAE